MTKIKLAKSGKPVSPLRVWRQQRQVTKLWKLKLKEKLSTQANKGSKIIKGSRRIDLMKRNLSDIPTIWKVQIDPSKLLKL